MKCLKILLTLIIALSLTNCFNPNGETVKNLRTSEELYVQYRSTADNIRSESLLRNAMDRANDIAQGCVQYQGVQRIFGNLPDGLVTRERASRELIGGPTCQCVPMGGNCSARSCLCSEICPADERILNSRAHQVEPSVENLFPFANTTMFNDTVFRNAPMTDGYCLGMTIQRKRFNLLGDFRPNMITIPSMDIPSLEWKEYTKNQLRRMFQGEEPRFIGLTSLEQLNRPGNEDLKTLFLELSGQNQWTNQSGKRTFLINHPIMGQLTTQLNFLEPTANRYEGVTVVDPQTNTPIPQQGSAQYQTYMRNQVRKILRGEAALLPGYSNLRSLAAHPAYAELIGDEIIREWREGNQIEKSNGNRVLESSTQFDPMTPAEISELWSDMTNNLPQFNEASYPRDSQGRAWNASGPIGTIEIGIAASVTNDQNERVDVGGHAIEAYAYQTLPDGSRVICIADPNTFENNNCRLNITFPPTGRPTYNGLTLWGSGWQLGKVARNQANYGRQGQMITSNIRYCREINANNFAQNDCGN